MIKGTPQVAEECAHKTPWGKCACAPKCWCGFGPHWGVHMGVVGKPNMVWGHEYKPAPNTVDSRADRNG